MKNLTFRNSLAALSLVLLVAASPASADVAWNTDAASNQWNTATNWSTGTVPTSADLVIFTTSDNYTTISHSSDAQALGVSFSGETAFTIARTGGVIYVYDDGITVTGGSNNQIFSTNIRPRGNSTFSMINNGTGTLYANGGITVHLPSADTIIGTFGGSGNVQVSLLERRSSSYHMDLVKVGAGTLTIVGANNTEAGSGTGYLDGDATTIEEGTIEIRASNALARNTVLTIGAGDAGGVDSTAGHLVLGSSSQTGISQTATSLTFASTDAADVNTVTIRSGGTLLVGDNFQMGSFTTLSDDVTVNATFSGDGTLQVGNTGENTANIVIGLRGTGAGGVTATLDMSGLGNFVANVNEFLIGQPGSADGANVAATVRLAESNTILANTITMGNSLNLGNSGIETLLLGTSNTIQADDIYVGRRKTNALLEFDTGLSTPSVTIADLAGTGGANLYVGYNDANTGTTTSGTVDFSAGTVDATFNNVVLGKHSAGAGSGSGTLIMAAGTITASSVVLGEAGGSNPANTKGMITMTGGTFNALGDVSDGGGTSTINLSGGTMNVDGELTVDAVNVGDGASAGTLNLSGTDNTVGSLRFQSTSSAVTNVVTIDPGCTLTVDGTGSLKVGVSGTTGVNANATFTGGGTLNVDNANGDLEVGLQTSPNNATPNNVAVLDLSGLGAFTANVDELRVGFGSRNRSTLILSDTSNSITANTIQISHSNGQNADPGLLTLGEGTNVIQANTINIARSKGVGTMAFASTASGTGTVSIAGKDTAEVDLNIADGGGTWTSGTLSGTLDLRGHEATVVADRVVVGGRSDTGSGGANGYVYLDQGSFTANTVELANRSSSGTGAVTALLDVSGTAEFTVNAGGTLTMASMIGTTGSATATVNLSGGTLTAPTIDDGGGTANFNFTGGTLHVGNFGFDLVQNGGTLAPGTSVGTTNVDGDYTLNSGTLEIEVDSSGYDQVVIGSETSLDYNVDLGSGLLELVFGGSGWSTSNDMLWIINNQTGGTLTDTFDNYATSGAVGSYDGRTWYLYYNADFATGAFSGGNDVLLTAVPEPSTLAMIAGLAGIGLLGWRRRRVRSAQVAGQN